MRARAACWPPHSYQRVADDWIFTPDTNTFDPTQVTGMPPYSIDEVMGTENWRLFDLATNQFVYSADSAFTVPGVDTHTVFGSMTNDDFAASAGAFAATLHPPTYSSDINIDLANFGGGFENEWVDIANGQYAGVSDLLITPMGDVTLLGTWPF